MDADPPGEPFVEYQLFAQSVPSDDFVAGAAYEEFGPGYIFREKAFAEGRYEPIPSFVGPPSEALLKGPIHGVDHSCAGAGRSVIASCRLHSEQRHLLKSPGNSLFETAGP